MKKVIFFLICLISIESFAQRARVDNIPLFDKRRLHYGFYLGLNQNDFKIDYRPSNFPDANITVQPEVGFNVGLIADLRLHKNINLRFEPGLVSNTKTLYFNHLQTARDSVREVGTTYMHLPLVFKFSTNRYKNIRPYLIAGVSYDHNFSSNQDNTDDNFSGEFRMQTSNWMYEVGIGIDIYLYYFKFSPSIRGVFAMNREIIDDSRANSPWTDPINTFATRGIFINFAFE